MQKKKTAYVSPNIAGILSLFDPALDWSADLSGDEYATALKEFLVVHQEGSKDPRKDDDIETDVLEGIRKEFLKVRKNKDLEYSVKKTKIKGNKFFDKDAPKNPRHENPDISQIFNAENIKPADTDPESQTDQSSALIPKRLDGIADSVESISLLLRRQLGLQQKQQRDAQVKQDQIDKQDREDDLEKKPDKKKGLIPDAIKKPALNFFEKIKKFFLNIVIGAAVYKLFDWLKDPANAEKITKFKDFLVDNAGWILGSLATLALLPTILTVVSVVKGILAGLALLGPLLPALPLILGGILVGAVAWWIGKKLFGADDEVVQASKNLKSNISDKKSDLNKVTEKGKPLLDPRPDATWLVYPMGHALQGRPVYSRNWKGNDKWKGEADAFDDPSGESKGRKFLIYPWTFKADGTTWGTEDQIDLATKRETALDQFVTDSKQMKQDVKTARTEAWHKLRDERAASEELKALRAMEKGKERTFALKDYEKETLRLKKIVQKEAEEEVKVKFEKDQSETLKKLKIDLHSIVKESSSADIDKNVKPNTNVPGPSNKNKGGQTQVIPGGGGQAQSGGGGGGDSQSSTVVPKISSKDLQNKQTVAVQAQYNKVAVD